MLRKHKICLSGRRGLLVSLTVLLIMLVLYFSAPDVFEAFDLRLLDWRFRLRGPLDSGGLVKLIVVDAADRHQYGLEDKFRDKLAGVLDQVCAGGARVVGLDIFFTGNPFNFTDKATRHLIEAADRCRNVVMGFNWNYDEPNRLAHAESIGRLRLLDATRSPQEPGFTPEMIPEKAQVADANLIRHAAAVGFFTILADLKKRAYKVPATQVYNKSYYYPFSLAVVRTFFRQPGFGLATEPGQRTLSGPDLGNLALRPDPKGYLWFNFYGGASAFPSLGFGDAVEQGVPADFARGAIVLIGVTGDDCGDLFDTPFDANTPGVVLHATAVANALSNRFLTRDLSVRAVELSLLVACALILGLLTPWLAPLPAITLGPILIAMVTLLSGTLFQRSAIWVQLACPLLEIIVLHLLLLTLRISMAEQAAGCLEKQNPGAVQSMDENPTA